MAKLSFFHLFLFVFLVFVVAVMVPEAHAQCSTVLNPNSCVLYDCGKHCFEQYKGIGRCLQKTDEDADEIGQLEQQSASMNICSAESATNIE
ncbi:defensin-like protein 156 [Quercus lobata]|uniref:defensin-like protein 156 n=1 Tax=Quercus lobata TaxID=97700 RepID=UPI0012459C4E|nr:defensin-like protein 156 [Quercus lobata]